MGTSLPLYCSISLPHEPIHNSQRPTAKEIEEAIAEEEEVLQLMSNSIEPQAEDLQTWKRAYQENPRLKTVFYKLRQGQHVVDSI